MKAKLFTGLAALIVCAIVVLACGAILAGPGSSFSKTNRDGSVVMIENVTFGRSSPYFYGSKKDRLLYHILPGPLKEPIKPGTRLGASPTLMQRIRMRATRQIAFNDPGTNGIAFWLSINRPPQGWVLPLTADGFPFGPGEIIPPGSSPFGAQTLSFFPRREKNLKLRFYEVKGKFPDFEVAQLGEDFTLPNPACRKYPTWKADTCPATVSDGKDEFKLYEFITRIPSDHYNVASDQYRTRATFQTSRDLKRRLWQPDSISLSDATGNVYPKSMRATHSRTTTQYEEWYAELPGALDPREAIRMEVRFTPQDKLGAEMVWETREVPLPNSDSFTTFSEELRAGDLKIELIGISAGQVHFPGASTGSSGPLIHLRVAAPQSADSSLRLCLVGAVGSDGTDFLARPSSTTLQDKAWLSFNYPSEATKARFTFALQRAKSVTFKVIPTVDPSSNAGKPAPAASKP